MSHDGKMEDVEAWARSHPDILRKIITKSSGAIGEIIVAQRLESIGFAVQSLNGHHEQRDLIVSKDNRSINVEVKCVRIKGSVWWVGKRPLTEPDCGSDIWCLVSAPRQADQLPNPDHVEVFVLTATEAAAAWDLSPYKKKSEHGGEIRLKDVPTDAKEAWGKFGL